MTNEQAMRILDRAELRLSTTGNKVLAVIFKSISAVSAEGVVIFDPDHGLDDDSFRLIQECAQWSVEFERALN